MLKRLLAVVWPYVPRALQLQLTWSVGTKFLVGVGAVCVNSAGQVLVLEHRVFTGTPWGVPRGFLQRNETPLDGVRRELREETGIIPNTCAFLYTTAGRRTVRIYFLCEVGDPAIQLQSSELRSYRWIDPANYEVRLDPVAEQVVAGVATRLTGSKVAPLRMLNDD